MTLEFLRPLPASAIVPVAIALFGLTTRMAIGAIRFGSIWPVLLSSIHGLGSVEPRLCEVERALGISRLQGLIEIAPPSAAPDVLAGLRRGLTVALILAVVRKMVAGLDDLGQWAPLAAPAYRSAEAFAGVALPGVIGGAPTLCYRSLQRDCGFAEPLAPTPP